MPVRGSVIGGPARASVLPISVSPHAPAVNRAQKRRVHQSRELPLRFLLVIGGNRDIVLTGILAPGLLENQGRSRHHQQSRAREESLSHSFHAVYYNHAGGFLDEELYRGFSRSRLRYTARASASLGRCRVRFEQKDRVNRSRDQSRMDESARPLLHGCKGRERKRGELEPRVGE